MSEVSFSGAWRVFSFGSACALRELDDVGHADIVVNWCEKSVERALSSNFR